MTKYFLPLFLLAFNCCFAQVNLNLGLRAYYPFSGNANDVSGNNNNPVFNNATLTADRFGNPNSAYHFNGSSQYMRISNSASLNTTNKLSLVAWVKVQGFYAGTCHGNSIIMKGDADGLPGNYLLRFDDGPFTNGNNCSVPVNPANQNFYGAGSASNPPGYTPYIQTNQWYCVVATYDGTTAKLYVNCELKVSRAQTITSFTNSFDVFFGRHNSATFPYWFNGDMDEVRIYDRALNIDEVNTLGGCITQTPCNNWLSTPVPNSNARIGDLDISGNQLTIEASFNRTGPVNPVGGYGFLISKHTNSNDINYAMWPEGCSVRTTNGQFFAQENCSFQLNKTYHVAMVYDGVSLKYYRNGFLHSQTPASGNLVLNDLITTIGQNVPEGASTIYPFIGNINEMRIWNVARTQAQLQTYMNNSLPNPTTVPGLLGYYTFDNLQNKQGNAAYNATLNGGAGINATNPNCAFVADSCQISVPCNNWLNTPTYPSTASIGNLNVTGNQITVEGSFNCTAYSIPNFGGNLIAKHTNASNVCYALSPHAAEISTSNNGYVVTLQNCPFQLNKTYHVAMVYDGASLKFYRDGFLLSQVACSGTIASNSLSAIIGNGPALPTVNQFIGQINELRIWNVARTQAEIRTYMNNSLPNPTTQPGLLAYYTFDNLLNKQGNPAWNATLSGGASINATNPNCTFTADSCQAIAGSAIINAYTPVAGFNICDNKLTVEDATPFNVGDTVLLIQMKGAVIDSTNTAAFGSITDYKNAGNYEFNYVKSKTGNVIELKNTLTRQYDIPDGKVQLIRVPYYNGSITTNDTLTCLPWDGNKGGVLVFNVKDTLNLNADIDVSGKGFRGGVNTNIAVNTLICNQNNYYYDNTSTTSAKKGEGIALIGSGKLNGRGKSGNGGGGGNGHNAGGGGGSNASSGGFGGYQLDNCGGAPFDNRGIGGLALTYNNTLNKIFLGGGGGAGHYDNVLGSGYYSNGGNGGGIVIINANKLISNNHAITSKGITGEDCIQLGFSCRHDGMAGGGAGGSVILGINTFVDNNVQKVNGGKGANLEIYNAAAGKVGPGGGGSGGVVWFKASTLPANSTVQNTGGTNGVIVQAANDPWGATAGATGVNLFNLVVPVSTIPFKPNIDSVRINNTVNCLDVAFNGLAYTNTNPVNTWQWYFGDGGTANTQNTSHVYPAAGTYLVKLVVTDINGCKDSIIKNIITGTFTANAGNDTSVCATAPAVSVTLHASAGTSYSWTPAALLNNPNVQNPVATITATTTFYVTITNGSGCSATDSVIITYAPPLTPSVTINSSANNVCTGTPITFTAVAVNGGTAPSFQWQKNGNPVGTNSQTYTDLNLNNGDVIRCILTSSLNCVAPAVVQSNNIIMAVSAAPANMRYPTLSTFPYQNLQLQARNIGNSYLWLPPVGLNNNTISNPLFYYSETQEYLVRINTSAGCIVVDTLLVEIKGKKGIYVPEGFTPNGDGNNDRLYPILVGIKKLNYFKIYNRWGNLLFETTSGRPEDGWDGTFKGKKQPVETYLWVVEGIDIDNITITKNGNTLLIR